MRIRSAHPGLLTDEAFMTLTVKCPIAIALLLGLWMEADDAGVFEWKPLTLKARILPAAPVSIDDLLAMLTRLNFVRRFEIAGKSLGVVRNFVKFQRPKKPNDVHPASSEMRSYAGFTADGKRPNAGTGRPPCDASSELVPNSPETTSESGPQMKEEGGRMKDVGVENSLRSFSTSAIDASVTGAPEPPSPVAAPKAARSERGCRLPEDWRPSDASWQVAEVIGMSHEQVETIVVEFRNYWLSEAGQRARKIDWQRTFQNRVAEVGPRILRQQARAGPRTASSDLSPRMKALSGIYHESSSNDHDLPHGLSSWPDASSGGIRPNGRAGGDG